MRRSEERQRNDRTSSRQRVVSIRLIISFATVALIAISVIGYAWVAERNGREVLTGELEARLLLEARNLASLSADALLSAYPELTLCPLVREIREDREDLAFVTVLDHQSKIKGHEDLEQLDQDCATLAALKPVVSRRALRAGESMLGNPQLLVASVPVVHANGRVLGRALVGMRKPYLEAMVARLRENFVLLTALLLAAGIVSSLVLMSWLLRPVAALRRGLERIGQGDLDTPLRIKDRTEFGLLAESVNGMTKQIKASQAEMLEKERLDHEMDLAHSMQQSLLPEGPVRRGNLICAGKYRAATEVGGDFFDIFALPNDKTGVVIADVSGKGLRGCLVTSMLAVLIRSLRDEYESPSRLLVALEQSLKSYLAPGMFVTIFYGVLDEESGKMVCASAAHCPLLIHRAATGTCEWLRTKGIPLGAWRGDALAKSLTDQTVTLKPGDLMLLFTDGLNEAWSPQRRTEFGFDRIAALMAREAQEGHAAVLNGLEQAARSWTAPESLGDDLTLLVVQRAAAPAASERPADPPDAGRKREDLRESAKAMLHEMLSDVHHLRLPSDLEQLERIKPWLEECPEFFEFDSRLRIRVESALFEFCANLIEHGYKGDRSQYVDVWWIPTPSRQKGGAAASLVAAPAGTETASNHELGYFIICDQGVAYDPHDWVPSDFNDPQVRRRGRGLGLNIVHSSTRNVVYSPETPAGNLTMLRFDPRSLNPEEEYNHV